MLGINWHLFHSFSFCNWNSTYWLGFASLSVLRIKDIWSFTIASSESRSIDFVNWRILSKLPFWVSSAVFSSLLCSFSLFLLLIFSSSLSTVSKFDNTSLYKLSSIFVSSLPVARWLIWLIFLELLKDKFGAFSAVCPILLLPLLS